jgi:ATP-binding cassette subfamily F protein 3
MAKQEADAKKAEGVDKSKVKNQKTNKAPEPAKVVEYKPQPSAAINKEDKKELQRMQKQFQQLEEKIAGLNKQKAELEASLIDPATYSDKAKFLQAETALKNAGKELALLNTEYEKVFEKIMELESK